ncbi:hypothetical protein V6Z11_D11G258500 [Gossypium hirsutum]
MELFRCQTSVIVACNGGSVRKEFGGTEVASG